MTVTVRRPLAWREPLAVAAGLAHRDGALALLSDGGPHGRRAWIGAEPDRVFVGDADPQAPFDRLDDFGPGTVGLASYDLGARPATGARPAVWPDLMLARYPALLAFDLHDRRLIAIGQGDDEPAAQAAADRAAAWLEADVIQPPPPAETFAAEADGAAYRAAVADVVARIGAGELFQANIARAWTGRLKPGADPFDVFLRLQAGRASAYGAFWRMGDRVLVSNSPELFLDFDGERIVTRPIKGTRPRGADAAADAALSAELAASAKDRAENLMIVDLMRNDLARAARPGTVQVERLFQIESLPTVHHLVSTVTAQAAPGVGPAQVLAAAFPPGSITGAPKHQAMKVIAAHEAPRGAWCGSLFLLAPDGGLTASVLIRTATFTRDEGGWSFRALAGAGIVADSDPAAELAETDAKIRAIREALTGD